MKVIRCELSINDGKSWRLANIKRYEEKPNREGKWWCWVHWEIDVNTGMSHGSKICNGVTIFESDFC